MFSLFLLLVPALAQEPADHCDKDQCGQKFEGKNDNCRIFEKYSYFILVSNCHVLWQLYTRPW